MSHFRPWQWVTFPIVIKFYSVSLAYRALFLRFCLSMGGALVNRFTKLVIFVMFPCWLSWHALRLCLKYLTAIIIKWSGCFKYSWQCVKLAPTHRFNLCWGGDIIIAPPFTRRPLKLRAWVNPRISQQIKRLRRMTWQGSSYLIRKLTPGGTYSPLVVKPYSRGGYVEIEQLRLLLQRNLDSAKDQTASVWLSKKCLWPSANFLQTGYLWFLHWKHQCRGFPSWSLKWLDWEMARDLSRA